MSSQGYTDKILKDLEDTEDGFFQIESKGDLAFLRISKPGSKGKKVEYKDVLARIQLFGVENFETEQIKKIVANPDNKEHQIGKWSKGHPEDASSEVTLGQDKMTASITLFPPKRGGASINEALLRESLAKSKITFGILESKFTNLIRNPEFFVPILIAEGKLMQASQDERIEIKFRSDNKPILEEDETGRIDFKEIGIIQSIAMGGVLAEKVPGKAGFPGFNVLGEEIPCPEPLSQAWKMGKNTYLEGNRLLASIAGRPVLDSQGEIRVDEVILLSAVDYSTGNIDFPGTIIVEDKIADGFSLEVQGSLVVKNAVGKVFLKAKGDIIIDAGFMGRGEGILESEGNIFVKFIEQGKLISGNNITVEEAVMHSELSAKDTIVVEGGRGEIIGGVTIAGKAIHCSKLGAVVETKTKVSVGTPPELLSELNHMKKDSSEKEILLKKVQMTMQKLGELSQKRELSKEEKENLLRLKEANEKYTKVLETLRKQFETALNSYEPNKESYVLVEKEIFPGVEISFGVGKILRVALNSIMGKNRVHLAPDTTIVSERMF